MNGQRVVSRYLFGQPWSCLSVPKGFEMEEEPPSTEKNQPAGDVMRLREEDMALFGLCPKQDDFYIVICELCGLAFKPMAMLHHMTKRHSRSDGSVMIPPPFDFFAYKRQYDAMRNKKLTSSTCIVSNDARGPPQKPLESNGIVRNKECYEVPVKNATPVCRTAMTNAENKVNGAPDKNFSGLQNASQLNSVNPSTCVNTVSQSPNSIRRNAIREKLRNYIIKSKLNILCGYRLMHVECNGTLVFRRNSKRVIKAAQELKANRRRHRKCLHRKLWLLHKQKMTPPKLPKYQIPSNKVTALHSATAPQSGVGQRSTIASSPGLVGRPAMASHPRVAPNQENNKPKFSRALLMQKMGFQSIDSASTPVNHVLSIDTTQNNNHAEVRCNSLLHTQLNSSNNEVEARVNYINENCVDMQSESSSTSLPDITWTPGHPEPLALCPLQVRRVGGLVSSYRDLNNVWLSMKATILEQDSSQSSMLCPTSSSQSNFYLHQNSSIQTILANLAAKNLSPNPFCRKPDTTLKQFTTVMNNTNSIQNAGLSKSFFWKTLVRKKLVST